MQQRVRRSDKINRDIISTVENKAALEAANTSPMVRAAYDQMIADLELERSRAIDFDAHLLNLTNLVSVVVVW